MASSYKGAAFASNKNDSAQAYTMDSCRASLISEPHIFWHVSQHFDLKTWLHARAVCKHWEDLFLRLCKIPKLALALGYPLCEHLVNTDFHAIKAMIKIGRPGVYLETLRNCLDEAPTPLARFEKFARLSSADHDWHVKHALYLINVDFKSISPVDITGWHRDKIDLLYKIMSPEEAIEFTRATGAVSVAILNGVEAWDCYDDITLRCPRVENHTGFVTRLMKSMVVSIDWKGVCPEHKTLVLSTRLRFPTRHLTSLAYHEAVKHTDDVPALVGAFRRIKHTDNVDFSLRYLRMFAMPADKLKRMYDLAHELFTRHNIKFVRANRDIPAVNELYRHMLSRISSAIEDPYCSGTKKRF